MDATRLTGLEGLNPLGFLAALGVQVLFLDEVDQPRLWWTDDSAPHAEVDHTFPVERIIEQALSVFPKWKESPALAPGFGDKAAKTGKFEPEDIRRYLEYSLSDEAGRSFPAALVAEGSLDSTGGTVAKPSDLYFTSGPQCFLEIARNVLDGVTEEDLVEGLLGSVEIPEQAADTYVGHFLTTATMHYSRRSQRQTTNLRIRVQRRSPSLALAV